jgi:hypothetical protein
LSTTESQISRRNLLKKSAAAGAVFWAVPVIESVTSRAAAASGGLTCGLVFVFYQHANGVVNIEAFVAGSNGSVGCTNSHTNPCPPGPCCGPGGTPNNCQTNTFTLSQGLSGTGMPAATANVPNSPYNKPTNGTVAVGPFPGGGNCNGQFSITGGVITATGTGNNSDAILSAFAIPNPTAPCTGTWACPTTLAAGNSIDLSGICG